MANDSDQTPGFAELYDRSFPKVYNYALYRLGDPAAADDVVSRVFEKALERLASFDPSRGPADAWLFGIARNAVSDHFRERRWRAPFELLESLIGDKDAGTERLVADEEQRALLAALEALDERQRELLALKFGGGMTNRDIAAQTGLSESNVGVLLYRAVKKLQTLIGDMK
ncbi:MAG: sigma-70 family RNA polymerase sigma factor [Elusimicrobia bacterium]|nr:sigma-70 family RNA polymerase sigma factor [Elusimicrobiota bacterium]